MKSYGELKAEMEAIQQQMAEAKKSERTNALKKKSVCAKSLALLLECLRARLLEGGQKNKNKNLFLRGMSHTLKWLENSRLFLAIYQLYSRKFVHLTRSDVNDERTNKHTGTAHTVSIVAVSYERLGELKVFVQSVVNQTQKNWKLHVMHDGHNDDFCSIMEKYFRDDPTRITYECTNIRFNDYGHSLREIGLEKASGEYILITNADNYYAPKALEFINDAIAYNASQKPDVVMFDMIHSHKNLGNRKNFGNREAPSYSFFEVIYKRNYIDIGAAIVERELAQNAGFDDKSFAADATYYENILKKKLESGSRLVVTKIPRVLLVHN